MNWKIKPLQNFYMQKYEIWRRAKLWTYKRSIEKSDKNNEKNSKEDYYKYSWKKKINNCLEEFKNGNK